MTISIRKRSISYRAILIGLVVILIFGMVHIALALTYSGTVDWTGSGTNLYAKSKLQVSENANLYITHKSDLATCGGPYSWDIHNSSGYGVSLVVSRQYYDPPGDNECGPIESDFNINSTIFFTRSTWIFYT